MTRAPHRADGYSEMEIVLGMLLTNIAFAAFIARPTVAFEASNCVFTYKQRATWGLFTLIQV